MAHNSIKSLQEEGKKIPKHLTITDLKRMIIEEAEKEALARLKRK